MRPIRILIVDDWVVVRQLVSKVLGEDPSLSVVGTAANGRIALNRLAQLSPDLIVLDVEMPDMNGLHTLAELRKTHADLPVIMFSTMTERGAAVTLEALALGASDYVTKPAGAGSMTVAMERVRDELVPRIKALCQRVLRPARAPAVQSAAAEAAFNETRRPRQPGTPAPAAARSERVDLLAIGVSTGGPNALAAILPELPRDLPVPVVIVQHMPPIFTRILAERLGAASAIPVAEGVSGVAVRPGQVWIAPGNFHMELLRDGGEVKLWLHQGPPENSCRPAVDALFRSVAEVYGPRALAVVLTGMGQDGLRGCAGIHKAGGQIIVQDEASSVVWGMPGNVVQAGLAHRVLPLSAIAPEVVRRVAEGRGPSRGRPARAELDLGTS